MTGHRSRTSNVAVQQIFLILSLLGLSARVLAGVALVFDPTDDVLDEMHYKRMKSEPLANLFSSAKSARENSKTVENPSLGDYHKFLKRHRRSSAEIHNRNTTTLSLTGILDGLLNRYDKRIRPDYQVKKSKRAPVQVGVSMWVSSVSSISEVNMDFTLDMYFRQRWTDKRLAFHHLIEGVEEDVEESVSVAEEMLTKIWWPDTFFVNAKKAEFHHATTRNAFLRIDSKGNVFHSLRLTVTAMCPMDLTYFPMDSQTCSLEIESFGYTTKDILYFWQDKEAVGIDKGVRLPQYEVRGKRQREKLIMLSTGNYSRLSVEFYFERSMGYYLIQIYIPSTLIVVISWVSFWLSRAAVPARVALGITTVLTMTTLISSTNASLPKISYLKSIDVYLVTCFVMVFASLLEYAAVSYIAKRAQNHQSGQFSMSGRFVPTATPTPQPAATPMPVSPGLYPGSRYRGGAMLAATPRETQGLLKRNVRRPVRTDEGPFLPQRTMPTEIRLTSNGCSAACHLRAATSGTAEPSPSLSGYPSTSEDPFREIGHGLYLLDHDSLDLEEEEESRCAKCAQECCSIRPSTIDKYSRILFPLTFGCFNIMYWVTYLYVSDGSDTIREEFQPL